MFTVRLSFENKIDFFNFIFLIQIDASKNFFQMNHLNNLKIANTF